MASEGHHHHTTRAIRSNFAPPECPSPATNSCDVSPLTSLFRVPSSRRKKSCSLFQHKCFRIGHKEISRDSSSAIPINKTKEEDTIPIPAAPLPPRPSNACRTQSAPDATPQPTRSFVPPSNESTKDGDPTKERSLHMNREYVAFDGEGRLHHRRRSSFYIPRTSADAQTHHHRASLSALQKREVQETLIGQANATWATMSAATSTTTTNTSKSLHSSLSSSSTSSGLDQFIASNNRGVVLDFVLTNSSHHHRRQSLSSREHKQKDRAMDADCNNSSAEKAVTTSCSIAASENTTITMTPKANTTSLHCDDGGEEDDTTIGGDSVDATATTAKIPFMIPLAPSSSRHNNESSIPCNESSAFSDGSSSKAPAPNLINTNTTEKAGSKEGRRYRWRHAAFIRRHKEAFGGGVFGKKYHSTNREETIPSRLRSGYGGSDGSGGLLLTPSQVAAVPSPVDLRAESFLILNI